MAEGSKSSGGSDLPFIILVAIVLILSWIGLPEDTPSLSSSILKTPSERTLVSQVKSSSTDDTQSPKTPIRPSMRPIIRFQNVSEGRRSNVGTEYLVIEADKNNSESVVLTNWYIRSAVSGEGVSLPEAVELPFIGTVNARQPFSLPPGGKAIIVTGRSPIGESFRLNKCTGYFEQFQDFSPSLPRQCPKPRDELGNITPELIRTYGDACIDLVQKQPQCQIVTKPLAPSYSRACQQFLDTRIHYNGCITAHKNDADFYKNEWRVYLARESPLWRDRREYLELIDPTGVVVDRASY